MEERFNFIRVMKKKKGYIIEAIITISFILIVFLVPLIFIVPVQSVDLTKIGVLYGGLSIILTLFVKKFFKEKVFPSSTSPIVLPVCLFFWSCILSTICSQYPSLSLIGDYNRFQGLLTITAYLLLFYISSCLCRKKKVLSLILDAIILSNFFAGIYGIIQRLGLDPYEWSGGAWTRIHSTFGNPVFYAAWLSMVLPLNLVLYLREENKKKRFIYSLSFIYTYILLLFANTRATFVGYFGASFLFSIIMLGKRFSLLFYGITSLVFGIISMFIIPFLPPNSIYALFIGGLFIGISFFCPLMFLARKFSYKNEILAISAICIIFTIIFNLSPSASIAGRFFATIELKKEKRKEQEKIEAVKDVSEGASESFSSSARIRIMMWKACLKIIKEHPIFGIGPETLGYVFPKYRDLAYIRRFSEFSLTNRAHNEILDTALNYGILGLAFYIFLFFTVFSIGIKAISTHKDKLLIIGILCLELAYLIQNEFSFSATTISSLSWVMIGILAGITSPEKTLPIESKAKRYFISLPFIFISFIFCLILIPYFIADVNYRNGRVYEESKIPEFIIIKG